MKNGLEGDDVYLSWHQAYPYYWDPSSDYFFPGSFCKGFNHYDRAWDLLLEVNPSPPHTQVDHDIPVEPPELNVLKEPSSTPQTFHHDTNVHPISTLPLQVSEHNENDDATIDT